MLLDISVQIMESQRQLRINNLDTNMSNTSQILQQFTKPFMTYDYKHQLQNFRKEIRRNQLDQFFHSRRIKLLASECNQPMDEEPAFLKKHQLDKNQLHSLARLSTTETGIDIINQAGYSQHLLQYLSSNYVGSEEQQFACHTLCNLSYRSKNPPSNQILTAVFDLMEENIKPTIADYLLCFLGNTMNDYQHIKQQLVAKSSMVGRLIAINSKFQNPDLEFRFALVSCILLMVYQAAPQPSFIKLRQILLHSFGLKAAPQTLQIIKKSIFSLSLLAKMYPLQLADNIIKGGVFERLAELYSNFGEITFVNFIVKMANAIMREFKDNCFFKRVLPILNLASSWNFESNKNENLNIHHLKLDIYKLINSALQQSKLKAEEFMISDIGKNMLAAFEVQDDPEMRRQFMFIFINVFTNTEVEAIKQAIEKPMLRTRELDYKNFEIVARIDALQIVPKTSNL